MSSSKDGARRPPASRILSIAGALVAIVALAVLSSGATAARKCEPLSTTTYEDPAGDGSAAGAPDLTRLTVTSYEDGGITLTAALADEPEFIAGMLIRTYLDTDKNATTGDPKGFEYALQSMRAPSEDPPPSMHGCMDECDEQPTTSLLKWNGSAWATISSEELSAWYGNGKLTTQVKPAAIGDAMTFNFAVYAAARISLDGAGAPVLDSALFDWAPNEGTYLYQPFESSVYADVVGDSGGAPDIDKVVVTKWNNGPFRFWIEFPGKEDFDEDMLLRLFIDSDSNPSTGDASGYEYLVRAQGVAYEPSGSGLVPRAAGIARLSKCRQPALVLLKWDGEDWSPVDAEYIDWYFNEGLKLAVDAASIGNSSAFNFAVSSASGVEYDDEGTPDTEGAPVDRAPDAGSYHFPLIANNAELVGSYKVQYKVTKARNFADLKRGKKFTKTWRFVRSCKKKTCVTKVVVSGGEKFKLARKGKAVYKAKAGRKFACEAGKSAQGTQKVQLRVKRGAWNKGKWRVAKWTGTVNVVSPANGVAQCGGRASYSAALDAKRK